MTRIAVVNAWSDDNKGDAAIVEGLVRALVAESEAPLEFVLVSMFRRLTGGRDHYRHTRRLAEHVTVRPAILPVDPPSGRWRRLRRVGQFARALLVLALGRRGTWLLTSAGRETLQALARADVVVSKAGHIYFSRGGAGSILGLFRNLFPILLAQRLGRPTVVYGQSIGPVRGRLQRWMVRRALSRLDALYVREPASLACVEELGVRGARLCWDSAFAVPAEPLPEPVAARLPARFVALTVRQWRFPYAGVSGDEAYDRYLSAVATTIGRLRAELELPVVVVPQAIGPTPVENDLTAARMLEEALGENAGDTVFLDDDFTAGQLTTLYGRAVFVLATRFHSAILAMSAGTPAVAVSYHGPKAPGIMEMLDLKSFVTDIAGTSPDELWSLCRGVLDRREEIEEALGRRRVEIARDVAVSCRAILELA